MQRYLKDLKPTEFADLIAMNALYRPGPLEYIPAFVRQEARSGAGQVRPRRLRGVPRRDLRHHRLPGAGHAAQPEVGGLHQGRGGHLAEGDGQKEGRLDRSR